MSNTLPTPVILPVMPKSDTPAAAAVASVSCTLPSIGDHLQTTTADVESDKSSGVQVLMNCDSTTGQLFVKQWSTMVGKFAAIKPLIQSF